MSVSTLGSAQSYLQLEKADSLALAHDYSAAIDILNAILEAKPRNFLKAQTFYQLSKIYLEGQELEKAYDYNLQSLKVRDKIQYEFIADNYLLFGIIKLLESDLEGALENFVEAKNLPHADLQFSGNLDGYLGTVYEQLGRDSSALENYKNSIEILGWELPENHQDISEAHLRLADFYRSKKAWSQAITHYEKIVEIEKASSRNKDDNTRLSRALNAFGQIIAAQQNDLDRARSFLNSGLLASKGQRNQTAQLHYDLARLAFQERQFDRAAQAVDQALDILEPKTINGRLPLFSTVNKSLRASCLHLKSQLLLEAFEKDQQVNDLLNAYKEILLAIELFEQKGLETEGGKVELQGLEDFRNIYDQSIWVALQLYHKTSDEAYLKRAFLDTERDKAQRLLQQLQEVYSPSEMELSRALQNDLAKIQGQFRFFETDEAARYYGANLNNEIQQLKSRYQRLLKQLKETAPRYYHLYYEQPNPKLKSVQETLKANEVLLTFYEGLNHYYAFAVSDTLSMAYHIPKDIGIQENTQASFSKSKFVDINYELYRQLIQPAASILKGKEKLVIIPDGDLKLITFETLLKKKPKRRIKHRKLAYLIKDFEIHYRMAAQTLVDQVRIKGAFSFSFAAFTDEKDKTTLINTEVITDLFSTKNLQTAAYTSSISEAQFKQAIGTYNHLYWSLPSFNDSIHGFSLTPENQDDGVLSTSEIMDLNLENNSLLLFDIIQNNSNDSSIQKRLETLNLAFQFAGATDIVVHEQQEGQQSAPKFLDYFYKKRLEKKNPAQALRYAKLKMIKKWRTANPRHWANFRLFKS